MTKPEIIEAIKDILDGIDREETEDQTGWWETSTGAEFGAKKLDEIIDLITKS